MRGNATVNKAEWILRSHRDHIATLKLLKARLQKAVRVNDSEVNNYIESQMFRHEQFNAIPKASCQSNRTEQIALTYHEQLQVECATEVKDLIIKIQDIRFYLQAYDAMIASLTPEELWLVCERYVNGKSFGRMLLEMPDSVGIRSKTTLSKRCAAVIDRLDCFLTNADVSDN